MRNPRLYHAMLIVMILQLAAIILLLIWGYRVYFSPKVQDEQSNRSETQTENVKNEASDTLPALPDHQIVPVDTTTLLNEKLLELELLQSQIKSMLNSREQPADTNSVNSEPDHFHETDSSELKDKKDTIKPVSGHQQATDQSTIQQISKTTNKAIKNNNHPPSARVKQEVFVSNLNVYGLTKDGFKTGEAASIRLIKGDLFVKSKLSAAGELIVVIRRPNGTVLIAPTAKPSTFLSENGRISYTTKVNFTSKTQVISFAFDIRNLPKGNYLINIYHKGRLIASQKKTLI